MCLVQERELQAQIAAKDAIINKLLADHETEASEHISSVLQREQELLALGCACINSAPYHF